MNWELTEQALKSISAVFNRAEKKLELLNRAEKARGRASLIFLAWKK
jgi:hypothetical protein